MKNNSQGYARQQPMPPTFMSVLRSAGYSTMMVGKDHLCPGQNGGDYLPLRSDDVEDLSGPRQSVDMDLLGVDRFVRAKDKRLNLHAKTNV